MVTASCASRGLPGWAPLSGLSRSRMTRPARAVGPELYSLTGNQRGR